MSRRSARWDGYDRRQQHLTLVRPLMDDLRQVAGFYLSEAVYTKALRLAGEDGLT